MKKYNGIVKLFIFLFILLSLTTTSYATENIIKIDVVDNIFENILNIINVVMVLINFIFVVFVFYNEKSQNKKNNIRKYNEYWYDKFVIDNNITLIDCFFEEVEKLLNKVVIDVQERNNDDKQIDTLKYSAEVFTNWTTLHNDCKSKFCEKLDVVMPEFSAELRNDFSNIQDYISNKINEIILCQDNLVLNGGQKEIINKLHEYKKTILEKVYLKGMPKEK